MIASIWETGYWFAWTISISVIALALLNRLFRAIKTANDRPIQRVGKRRGYGIVAVALVAVIAALIQHHVAQFTDNQAWYVLINASAFMAIAVQLCLAHTNKTWKAREVIKENVVVVVPVFNEDPITFKAMLESLSAQQRLPDMVYVIDDGSNSNECERTFNNWQSDHKDLRSKFHRQVNSGKREAQAVAFRDTPDATIYVTVDSDTVLDSYALENIIKPFIADEQVKSVAGLLLGLNWNKNLLTRLIDLGFVTSFLSGRAAWSRLNSVSVNCGGLGAYSASIVRKHLDEYVNQLVAGKRVTCGDDRILTNLAGLEGKTVFQESAVGYTAYPENLSHLSRQRIRWWRSFFWGSEWLTRRYDPRRIMWWQIVFQLIEFVLYTAILFLIIPWVLIVNPVVHQHVPFALFVYVGALGYLRNCRYLSIKRPDQKLWEQVLVFLLAPLAVLLNTWLCTVLQYVGLATVKHTGWSTRETVEVTMEPEEIPSVTS